MKKFNNFNKINENKAQLDVLNSLYNLLDDDKKFVSFASKLVSKGEISEEVFQQYLKDNNIEAKDDALRVAKDIISARERLRKQMEDEQNLGGHCGTSSPYRRRSSGGSSYGGASYC